MSTWADFCREYPLALAADHREHPDKYAYGPERVASVAEKMLEGLARGMAHWNSPAIRATCKVVGIPHTRTAIVALAKGHCGGPDRLT